MSPAPPATLPTWIGRVSLEGYAIVFPREKLISHQLTLVRSAAPRGEFDRWVGGLERVVSEGLLNHRAVVQTYLLVVGSIEGHLTQI